MTDTTIAAISTAQGQGGIGIIRISGSNALEIADKVFVSQSERLLSSFEGYKASYGKALDKKGETLDEVVAIVYRAPKSYTGENVVELCCHGGLYVTRQVLRAVLDAGAVLAEPGEFTKRAFLNGKMDLSQAQAVMDIISAKSSMAARAAVSVRGGTLRKRIDEIKSGLVSLAGHLCAWADYPEEDIPEVTESAISEILSDTKEKTQKLLSTYDAGQAIIHGVDTVIAGRPNVGKSTLMNLLTGFEKSIVTDIAGTTRDVVEETVIVGGVTLRLCDTAGIRDTDNLVEKIGVDRTRERLSSCSLVLAMFDISEELSEEDTELIESLKGVPSIAIINKTDLDKKLDTERICEITSHVIYISAKTGDGKEDLEKAIAEVTGTKDFDPSVGVLTSERQRAAANKALRSIIEAETTLNSGFSFDAVTVCIEDAIESLLELTGENVSDAVVDDVFHSFCVGK